MDVLGKPLVELKTGRCHICDNKMSTWEPNISLYKMTGSECEGKNKGKGDSYDGCEESTAENYSEQKL